QRCIGGELPTLVARDHGDAGASFERGLDGIVAVAALSLDGEERLALADGACIDRQPRNVRRQRAGFFRAHGLGHIVDGPERSHKAAPFSLLLPSPLRGGSLTEQLRGVRGGGSGEDISNAMPPARSRPSVVRRPPHKGEGKRGYCTPNERLMPFPSAPRRQHRDRRTATPCRRRSALSHGPCRRLAARRQLRA